MVWMGCALLVACLPIDIGCAAFFFSSTKAGSKCFLEGIERGYSWFRLCLWKGFQIVVGAFKLVCGCCWFVLCNLEIDLGLPCQCHRSPAQQLYIQALFCSAGVQSLPVRNRCTKLTRCCLISSPSSHFALLPGLVVRLSVCSLGAGSVLWLAK